MKIIDSIKMVSITVADMKKSRAFYVDTLGLKVKEERREDDDNWWVSMEFPGGGSELTLGRAANYGAEEPLQPGMAGLYMATTDVEASHKELTEKGLKTGEIMDDLFGPGSGVQFFNISDPDGNSINILQPKS